ncbi:MAG: porin family protein [Muribaculaceae bacterium]
MNVLKASKYFLIASLITIAGTAQLNAINFLDTSTPDSRISLGIRIGVNSSNQGLNLTKIYPDVKKGYTEWKAGFDVGAVVDLNINNFFTIQPGFFFQNRSYDYTIITSNFNAGMLANKFGHTRNYSFQIPMLLSFRFNLSNDFRWHLDFGPYIAFGLGGYNKIDSYATKVTENANVIVNKQYEHDYYTDSDGTMIGMSKFDWGFKMGTAFSFRNHYYLGIHYNAGCKNVANPHANFLEKASAKNKSWSVSLGYDF